MVHRFIKSKDWKEKLNGYCPCFTGGDNKVGLRNNQEVCNCNGNELKFTLLSNKKLDPIELTTKLIKINLFTRKEILQALSEITKKRTYDNSVWQAQKKLTQQGYIVFYDENRILKAYEKEKV